MVTLPNYSNKPAWFDKPLIGNEAQNVPNQLLQKKKIGVCLLNSIKQCQIIEKPTPEALQYLFNSCVLCIKLFFNEITFSFFSRPG